MKKIFIILLIFLFTQNFVQAAQELEFIYINGSNNNNTRMKKWFFNGIKNLHPMIKKKIMKNEQMIDLFLDNGKYYISDTPSVFFWGDKSKQDLEFMTGKIELLKGISPFMAYKVRLFIAECLHDAIWVQKTHNMIPIVEELDKKIDESSAQNKKVVLLGYSAGSFITYQYIFTKFPYLDLKEYFDRHPVDKDLMEYIKKNPKKDTCFYAFSASDLATVTAMDNVVPNPNKEEFLRAYQNIDKFTDKYCVPNDTVYGVINFASPIPLFYSDLSDPRVELNIYNKWLFRYLIEHEFFWLTVNYVDDPMGYPNGVNLTNDEIEKITTLKYDQQKGFVYDYSKTWSWVTFLGAHTSYWVTKRRFANAIVKGYIEGYKFQYDPEFQQKHIKKRSKK